MRDRLLAACARLAHRRPLAVCVTAILLAVLAALYAARTLVLDADTDNLIAADRPYMRDYRAFLEEFGDLEHIVVVVDGRGDRAAAERAVDDVENTLRAVPGVPAVHGRVAARETARLAAWAMPTDDLAGLAEAARALPVLARARTVREVADDAAGRIARLVATGALAGEERNRELAAAAILEAGVLAGEDGGAAAGRDAARLLDALDDDAYLTTADGALHFVRVAPAKDYGTLAVIEEPLARTRAALEVVRARHPAVAIGLTGKPVLQADEMATTDRDMTRASVAAVVLVALLFMIVMGGVLRPAAAVAALLIGIAWTFGAAALVVGRLNLLSVIFTLILVGIGIDFGVHLIARYLEEGRERRGEDRLRAALVAAGRGNVPGAVTSAAAFYMALFTDFQGLRELGFIAGTGLVLCLVAMLTVLPALLALIARRTEERETRTLRTPAQPPVDRSPRRVLIATAVATAAALVFMPRVGFDANVIELQARDLDSVVWEKRILAHEGAQSWFGALRARDLDELARLDSAAREHEEIAAVHSVRDLGILAPETPEHRRAREALAAAADEDAVAGATEGSTRAEDAAALDRLADRLGGLAERARAEEPEEALELARLARRLARLGAVLREGDAAAEAEAGALARRLAQANLVFGGLLEGAGRDLRAALPELTRTLFASDEGWLATVHPRDDVWDVARLEAFVAALREVSPRATGVPITHLESIRDMRRGFLVAALLALTIVLLAVALDFRRPLDVVLAALPLVFGGLWLVGAMGVAGLDFNLANFFAAPILIGIGVDNGVHVVHRWRENGRAHARLRGTARAIVLTSATTIIGFGGLAFASHLGLRSLGLVMAMGAFFLLLASLFVLPAVLALISRPPAAPAPSDRAAAG